MINLGKYQFHVILITGFIFLAFASKANDVIDSLMKKGNEYYLQHQFEMAESCYTRILNLGYESGDLYYNLGNAYYKQSNYAKAILNYEKALQMNPGDKDIRDNLELANLHIIDRIEVIPDFFLKRWMKGIRGLLSPDQWALLSILLFGTALVSFSIFFIARRIRVKKAGFVVGIVLFALSVLSLTFMYSRIKSIRDRDSAIIMAPSVDARSSPDEQSTNVFVLHEGTKVMITDSVQSWKEIRIANGNTGWIKSESLEEI